MGRVSVEEFLLGRETGQGSGARFGSDWVDVLRDIPLFKPLSKRHVRRIANLARPHRFAEGTAIVRKGERGETFFLIIDGEATVTLPRRKSIALGAGDWFGELALLDGNPRSATVTARTPVLTMRIARRPFLKLIAKDSELTLGLLKGMTERLRALSGPVP